MGTHPTLPSRIIPPPSTSSSDTSSDYVNLSSHIEQYPSLVGDKVCQHFYSSSNGQSNGSASSSSSNKKADLPFLFKVLSIGKALSIQAHPDKKLAKKLHFEKPKMYKDDNHKPEMAIALTGFKGFCGFRPIAEIVQFLNTVPEFKTIVKPSDELLSKLDSYVKRGNNKDEKEKKSLLRQIFAQLIEAKEEVVKDQVEAISNRYQSASSNLEVDAKLAQLVCKLNKQYPSDVGVFCSFLLNVLELQKGQSMFLMANEPHAYLEGEIIECMAASDNVVRAGLTPKARDIQVLVDMLTYTDDPSHEKLMKAKAFLPDEKSDNYNLYKQQQKQDNGQVPTLLYDPPIEEFSVLMTRLAKDDASELQRPLQGPSILIVTSGSGTLTSYPPSGSKSEEKTFQLNKPGQVFFVGAQTKIRLQGDLVVFRSFVEV